jgi:hypothetical protein
LTSVEIAQIRSAETEDQIVAALVARPDVATTLALGHRVIDMTDFASDAIHIFSALRFKCIDSGGQFPSGDQQNPVTSGELNVATATVDLWSIELGLRSEMKSDLTKAGYTVAPLSALGASSSVTCVLGDTVTSHIEFLRDVKSERRLLVAFDQGRLSAVEIPQPEQLPSAEPREVEAGSASAARVNTQVATVVEPPQGLSDESIVYVSAGPSGSVSAVEYAVDQQRITVILVNQSVGYKSYRTDAVLEAINANGRRISLIPNTANVDAGLCTGDDTLILVEPGDVCRVEFRSVQLAEPLPQPREPLQIEVIGQTLNLLPQSIKR